MPTSKPSAKSDEIVLELCTRGNVARYKEEHLSFAALPPDFKVASSNHELVPIQTADEVRTVILLVDTSARYVKDPTLAFFKTSNPLECSKALYWYLFHNQNMTYCCGIKQTSYGRWKGLLTMNACFQHVTWWTRSGPEMERRMMDPLLQQLRPYQRQQEDLAPLLEMLHS